MLRERFVPYGEPAPEPTYGEIDALGSYPPDPLLNIGELDEIIDLRHLIPEDTRRQLSEDEIVVRVGNIQQPVRRRPPSNLQTLKALSGATSVATIGENGPVVAALSGSENASDTAQNRFVAPHVRDAILAAVLRKTVVGPVGSSPSRLRFPLLVRTTLLHTAKEGGITEEQYREDAPFRQERPGKSMLVNFGLGTPGGRKFSRYLGWGHPIYTSVDAAPLFIARTADYIREEQPDFLETSYVARDQKEHPLAQFFDLAIDRLVTDVRESREGFLEFKNLAPWGGMLNQAWADSASAYVHANGEWANHDDGIAAVEVQGYAYDALRRAAAIYRTKFYEPGKAAELEAQAEQLRQSFLETFFITDAQGTYAVMARDYDNNQNGRPLQVRHANMGLLLETGILDGDDPAIVKKRTAIIDTLFSEGMLTRYGIRTLDKYEVAYRPGGDHIGQIWPHINEAIARGLIKYGDSARAYYLRRANWLIYNETNAEPEYIRGDSVTHVKENQQEIVVFNRRYDRTYMFEIRGQRDQAWANEAILAAKYSYQPLRAPRVQSRLTESQLRVLATLPAQDVIASS